MPSGPPACQLQASAPPTGVTASSGSLTGWLTPTAGSPNSLRGQGQDPEARKAGGHTVNLQDQARLAQWPTPAVRDGKGGYLGGRIRDGELSTDTLDVTAQLSAWPTPVAQDDNKSPEAHLAMKERMGGNRTAVTSLQVMAKMTSWPTPVVEDARSSARHGYMKEGHAGTTMLDAARLTHWPTPKAMEVDESPETYHARGLRNPNLGPRSSPASLGTCVKLTAWPTPKATNVDETLEHWSERREIVRGTPRKGGVHAGKTAGRDLEMGLGIAARLTAWPTPTAANADGGQQPKNVSSTGKREDGSKATVSLGMIAKLTGWPTPHANSTTGAGTQGREGGENASNRRPWDDLVWLPCRDGKYRPTQPGLFPLAHGVSGRVGRLRAYGNAIVPQVAAEFIKAYS